MSTVKANDLMKVDGGIPTVKSQQLIPTAWVNFNGTSTVAIRDSENVSSITDSGTGNYRVNFSTNMANANYCITTAVQEATALNNGAYFANPFAVVSTSQFGLWCGATGYHDCGWVFATVMGGQA